MTLDDLLSIFGYEMLILGRMFGMPAAFLVAGIAAASTIILTMRSRRP